MFSNRRISVASVKIREYESKDENIVTATSSFYTYIA